MNVAYITADRGAPVFGAKGASVHIQGFAEALATLGHRVTIFTNRRGDVTSPLRAEVIKVAPDPAVPAGDQSAREEKERRYLAFGSTIGRWVVSHHEARRFDLVYERYSLWSAAGVRAAAKIGVPCFVEVNAPLLLEQKQYRELVLAAEAEAIEGEVFRRADALLAVSQAVRNYVLARGGRDSRAFVVPNGVDLARFNPAVAAAAVDGLRDDAFVIGFVGSLKAWHGIEILLETFQRLRENGSNCHLLIVGDGPLRPWIEGFVRGSRLNAFVTITGWVAHDRLPGLVQRMNIAVAPYPRLNDFYFSPLKLYEYLAVGKPVVASDVGQVREALDNGRAGLLVRPGDPAALTDGIDRLCHSSELCRSLSEAAWRRAQSYTWRRNAQRAMDLAASLAGVEQ